MNKRDPKDRNRDRRNRHEEDERDERERRHRPHGTGYGTEQAIYREYLARRWDGSNPPTPEVYSRAAQLWRQLPGSVIATASDLGSSTPSTKPTPPSQPGKGPANSRRG